MELLLIFVPPLILLMSFWFWDEACYTLGEIHEARREGYKREGLLIGLRAARDALNKSIEDLEKDQ